MNLKDQLSLPIFQVIRQASEALGVKSYVVGGWVRDLIINRESNDIDILCIGSGIELAKKVSQIMGIKNEVAYFKNFGTAMIHYYKGGERCEIEFVGARKESYSHNSRKPIVENGTLEDDLNRRDFTINALALSLSKEDFGELVDHFEGLKDLENGVIRTPCDADITFSDDPLRMMRAIRFATQLDFVIHNPTFEAIQRNASRLEIISCERTIDELNKIMLAKRPSNGIKLLEHAGLLPLILPEVCALKGIDVVDKKGHKDNYRHTLEVLDNICKNTDKLYLRWAALLHDIGKAPTKRFDSKLGFTFHGHEIKGAKMVKNIFRRLKLPLNENMHYVEKMVLLHMRPIALVEDIVTDSAVRRLLFDAGEDIDDLMMLCNADITSKNYNKVLRFRQNFAIVKQKLVEIEAKDKIRCFQPPVTGEDIMKAFDIAPCAKIGQIKTVIKDSILDGVIPNERGKAIELMYSEGAKLGLQKKEDIF